MIFLVKRKLFGLVPVTTYGFRRIVGRFEIWQIDVSPLFGVTTALRSSLVPDETDPARTVLLDDLEITMPRILKPFQRVLEAALRRHTRLQCAEDETFRARRVELKSRGIHLPPSILNRSAWQATFERPSAPDSPA